MHFPDFQIGELEPFDPPLDLDLDVAASRALGHRGVHGLDESSLYFTPRGTPQRELALSSSMGPNPNVVRKTSSLKSTPTKEATAAESYRAIYRTHRKSKSISSFLPQKWLFSQGNYPQGAGDGVGSNGGTQRTVRAIIEHVAASTLGGGSIDCLDEASNLRPVEVRDRFEATNVSSGSAGPEKTPDGEKVADGAGDRTFKPEDPREKPVGPDTLNDPETGTLNLNSPNPVEVSLTADAMPDEVHIAVEASPAGLSGTSAGDASPSKNDCESSLAGEEAEEYLTVVTATDETDALLDGTCLPNQDREKEEEEEKAFLTRV